MKWVQVNIHLFHIYIAGKKNRNDRFAIFYQFDQDNKEITMESKYIQIKNAIWN